jgi:hypothetical protein
MAKCGRANVTDSDQIYLIKLPFSCWPEDSGMIQDERITQAIINHDTAPNRQGRPAAVLVTAALFLALGLGWLAGSNAHWVLKFLYTPNKPLGDDESCLIHSKSPTELAEARSYLIQTASPSHTMTKQGSELAIERLHPEFAIRLAKAIREGRDYGLVAQSEATGAAQVVAGRFGADPTIVKFNTKKGGDATTASLAATLRATGKNMDDANDVLFVILTSHGSPDGLAVVAGRRQETLTPAHLADMLNATHVRYRAVVISACYSGVFIPWLANPNSLVVTAADANHSSFGCEDRAKWRYFGDAFFNVALRRTTRLKDAFALARALVRQREARNGFVPSHPQMAGGDNVEPLLIARP